MCCGKKRSELQNSQPQRTTRTVPQRVPSYSGAHAVRNQAPAPHAIRAVPQSPPSNSQARSVQPPAATTTEFPHSSIGVRYLENSPIRVRGPVSGRSYEFSGTAPIQQVDARDAASLLNTRFFRRA
jgi:hypothetical protein